MEKTTILTNLCSNANCFSGKKQLIKSLFVLPVLLFFIGTSAMAQCTIVVNDQVNVGLNSDCEAVFGPLALLEASPGCSAPYTIEIFKNGQLVESNGGSGQVTMDGFVMGTSTTYPLINEMFVFRITENASGNNQMGNVWVSDNQAPVIVCTNATTSCVAAQDFLPEVIDNCGDAVVNLVRILPDLPGDCEAGIVSVMRRVYQAVDASGNASEQCTVSVSILRIDLEEVVFPETVDLSCSDTYAVDGNGNPAPAVTGTPTIDIEGDVYNLFPNTASCNTTATYVDLVVPSCGAARQIRRMWTVTEWCDGNQLTTGELQIINILSDVNPTFVNCPTTPLTFSTGLYDCNVDVPARSLGIAATNVNGCSAVTQITVIVEGGNIISNLLDLNQSDLLQLTAGANNITYIAYDGCNNTDTCQFVINVLDQVFPVAVCKQFTTVSLNNFGEASVFATSFDNGSWDNCGIATIEARRMTAAACDPTPVFADRIDFCCADVGEDIMVVLRVTDLAGNSNECMVNIVVQDKIAPVIVCPSNITVDCNFVYTDLDVFGKVVLNDESLRENIIIDGEIVGVDGIVVDICGAEVTTTVILDNVNECGVGQIVRRFTATDPDGRTTSCDQTITFISTDPFYINQENPNDPTDDVVWPAAMVTINSCGADVDPDVTGRPVLLNAEKCALPGVKYEDWVFQIVGDACFKIVRTWTIIDWCQPLNGSYVMWTFDQTIKVLDNEAPVFAPVEDVSVCSFDASCEIEFIDLTASASDNCTPDSELVYTWLVNANYNPADQSPAVFASGNGNDASGIYPVGTHRVVFTADDRCGNRSVTSYLFTVANCKKPSPVCRNLIAELMEMTIAPGITTGMIEIQAEWFNAASFATCGGDLIFSFSSDITETSRVFTCSDIGLVTVEIWATDIFGNQDFCTTTIDIQDNMDVCDSGSSGIIAGKVMTGSEDSVEEVAVNVLGNGSSSMIYTEANGKYRLPALAFGNNYTVQPNKDVDPLNGVTTLDIVLIQRHILGAALLDSPYKMIAADINRDGKVNALDIVELRQLVLLKASNFSNNTSWRFVDSNYEFESTELALAESFPESVVLTPFNNSVADIDFVAVKIGDINGNAKTHKLGGNEDRSNNTANFVIENRTFEAGETVVVPVRMSDLNSLTAYQFTMKYNASDLNLIEVQGGKADVIEDNFAVLNAELGIITGSWGSIEAITFDADEVLFTLVFEAGNSSKLSNSLVINSTATMAVAYDAGENEYNLGVEFRSVANEAIGSLELRQNVPNPFINETLVTFNLPSEIQGTFNVYDVAGKVVYTKTANFNAGENQIVIRKSDLGSSGVFYYEVRTEIGSATKKMVLVN